MLMKKCGIILAMVNFLLGVGFLKAAAFDVNLEAQTRITQTDYIQNEVLDVLNDRQPLSKTEAYEKLTLKCKKQIDDVQFVFENRLLLWADQTTTDHTVDNAYFSITNGPLIFYLGKQRIKWGTGYFWNPTDVLQAPKDVFDLSESLEGILALRGEYSNPWLTPSLIIALSSNDLSRPASGNYKFAVQLYKLIGTMDLFVNAVYWHDKLQSIGGALSWDVDWFIVNAEIGTVKYQDDHYSVRQALQNPESEMYYNYVLGLARQLGETFFMTVEYYHHGAGLNNTDFDLYIDELRQDADWLQYLGPAMKMNYAAYNASYTLDNAWGIEVAAIAGLDDGTFYVYPRLRYVGNPNYGIELGYFKNFASAMNHEGYYATLVQYAVELRLTGYF
ncbi:hypothetical protein JW933_00395 [candidate division FCPU426 bacterium]|nr:hypothetical protein [candidate division FCPU426 bacterium]